LNPISAAKLAGAGGFFGRGIGEKKIQKILDVFPTSFFGGLSVDDLLTIEGIEQTTADQIYYHMPDFGIFLNHIVGYYKFDMAPISKSGTFKDQNIVFTGFRDKKLQDTIEKNGGKVGSSVSKNTTLVVVKDINSTSDKIKKAITLGIEIISYDNFLENI
jgi:DNA ligase (NAD+)